MWKKDDRPDEMPATGREPRPDSTERGRTPAGGQRATIGRSIKIRGEVSGDEDLLIQGHVDGTVNLQEHSVTIGSDGDVKANITARVITVEGTVRGDLIADEQVILRSSAQMEGDIAAPRLVLEDGARFRGGVDMGDPAETDKRAREAASSSSSASSPSARSAGSSTPQGSTKSSDGKSTSGSAGSGSSSATSTPKQSGAGAGSGASS